MKFKIKGEEFEIDFLDADEMERIEAAIQTLESKNKPESYEGMTQSQLIRKQCSTIFTFFDEVFGEGAHKRIFKGKCNLRDAIGAFEDFVQAKNGSAAELKEIGDRYTPNRAQRRAEMNGPRNGNGGNYRKNHNRRH